LPRTSDASLADIKEWRNRDESDSAYGREALTRDERIATGEAQTLESNSLVLMHVNCRISSTIVIKDIWRNAESSVRLLAGDCLLCVGNNENNEVENIQTNLNRQRKWAFEN
jgi:hypothetical protein